MIINTPKGPINSDDCTYKEGNHENDNEIVSWQEYWLGEELVKRDVQMHLKQGVFGDAAAG
jgi:hypothetical protein